MISSKVATLRHLRDATVTGGSIFALLATIAPTAVMAQGIDVADIVVTAQKRAERLQDVPIAITAISGDDLRERGVKTLTDLTSRVPGTSFGDVSGAPQIFARGVGFNTLSSSGENGVAVHIDGIYIKQPGAVGMLQRDLSRIEFLRGPQGTLYGRNAIGGVLNLVTTAPTDTLHAGASASYGNYNAYEISGYVSGPVSDTVRVRLYGEKDDRDGYVKNLSPLGSRRYDGSEGYTLRAGLDADASESASVQLRLFRRWESYTGPVHEPTNKAFATQILGLPADVLDQTLLSFDPYTARLNTPAYMDRSLTGGSMRWEFDLGNVQIVSNSSYMRYKWFERAYDGDGTVLDLLSIVHRHSGARTFTQELNVIYNSGPTNLIVGAYHLNDLDKATTFSPNALIGPGQGGFQRTYQKFQSVSAFADLTYRFDGGFSLYAGVRGLYEKTHAQLSNYAGPISPPAQPPLPTGYLCYPGDGGLGDQRFDTKQATGRAGARFEFSRDSNIYGQYSRGYKGGVASLSACEPPAKPEHIDAFEMGTKNVLAGGQLRLNAAAFYYDYHDSQVESVVLPRGVIFENADARIYGIEGEAEWRPNSRLNLFVGFSWLNAKYTDFTSADFLNILWPGYSTQTDLKGNRLNRSPKYTLNFGAQYDQPIGNATLRFRTDVMGSAGFFLRQYNLADDRQPGFTKIDGSVTLLPASKQWYLRGFVKNLTNEATIAGMLSAPVGQESIYAPPRTYGVEVGVSF